jgi:hypothetical protein
MRVPIKIIESEPKLYALVFVVDNHYKKDWIVAYTLEQAVSRVYAAGCSLKTLTQHFAIPFTEIQSAFKYVITP